MGIAAAGGSDAQPSPTAASVPRVFGVGVMPGGGGLQVVLVQPGSIAAKSGILPGDVLVSLDGEPINQKGDVQRIVATRAEGSIVSIHLVRNGAPMDLATQL
jgi:serine protease Do